MDSTYDPVHMQSFYDTYGLREWERFERDPASTINFLVHRHLLQRFIRPGDRVLDIGAGPGRFTIELARLGATVVVGDLSPVQLELNREKVREAGYEEAVEARQQLDIVDLSLLPDAGFDAVVCFGGPLSYVFDRADGAVDELLRVTKPGGYLLLSVMSLAGAMRESVGGVLDLARQYGAQRAIFDVLRTGNLGDELNRNHPMHLFRASELRALLERHNCEIVAMAAANFLAPGNTAALSAAMDDAALWNAVVETELELCQEPGAIDGGTHIIAVVRRLAG